MSKLKLFPYREINGKKELITSDMIKNSTNIEKLNDEMTNLMYGVESNGVVYKYGDVFKDENSNDLFLVTAHIASCIGLTRFGLLRFNGKDEKNVTNFFYRHSSNLSDFLDDLVINKTNRNISFESIKYYENKQNVELLYVGNLILDDNPLDYLNSLLEQKYKISNQVIYKVKAYFMNYHEDLHFHALLKNGKTYLVQIKNISLEVINNVYPLLSVGLKTEKNTAVFFIVGYEDTIRLGYKNKKEDEVDVNILYVKLNEDFESVLMLDDVESLNCGDLITEHILTKYNIHVSYSRFEFLTKENDSFEDNLLRFI